jgi:hypothetical protein
MTFWVARAVEDSRERLSDERQQTGEPTFARGGAEKTTLPPYNGIAVGNGIERIN